MNSIELPSLQRRLLTPELIKKTPGVRVPLSQPILRKHGRTLSRMFRHENTYTRQLFEPCLSLFRAVEGRTNLLNNVRPSRLNLVPLLVRLAHHESDWIRSPQDWIPDASQAPELQWKSLIDHLLVRYPLPSFCYDAWKIDGPLVHIEREWFCHLAGGGSLRTFPGWIPRMSRRSVGHFFEARDVGSMREAVRYAQVKALSPSPLFLKMALTSRLALDFSHDHIWLPLLEMWIDSPESRDEDFNVVVDFLWAHCHLDEMDGFRLKGRTADSLVHSAMRFFRDLAIRFQLVEREDPTVKEQVRFDSALRTRLLGLHADSWEPFREIAPFSRAWRGWQWEIKELCNPLELAEEGADMEHCVALYTGDCKRGDTSIFSMRSRNLKGGDLDRELTIEVNRKSKRVVQVKAWRNRRSHSNSRQVVLQWCEENDVESGAWTFW